MLISSCNHKRVNNSTAAITDGILDLRNTGASDDGPVYLNGDWEFYYGRLLTPTDFNSAPENKNIAFIKVPGLWSDQLISGTKLNGSGYATYRLRILYGPGSKTKTITLHRIYSSYRLWINGHLMDEKGMPDSSSKSGENYVFIHNKKTVSFTPVDGANEIVLQTANSDQASGGIGRPLCLENEEITTRNKFIKHTIEMIIVGLVLFFSLNNLILYYFHRENSTSLYFGFFCFFMAVNIFNLQIPILSGPFAYPRNPYMIDYLSVILILLFCQMTVWSMLSTDFSTPVLRFYQIQSFIFLSALFFIRFRTAEQMMKVFLIIVIIFLFYDIYVFIRAIKNNREDALLFFIGFTPGFLGGINDALYTLWIIDTTNVFHYTIIILCITTDIVISRRFAKAMQSVELLSKDLMEKNLSLKELDRLKSRFLANTSHELRTPLHGMIGLSESMLDGSAGTLSQKARDNLSLIVSSGHRLTNMVNDLLDMEKIRNKGISLNLRPVYLHHIIDMVMKLSLPLAGGKQIEFINRVGADLPPVSADEDRVRQVLHNIIGNAIKFTNKGKIEISANLTGHDNDLNNGTTRMVEVSISDTGIGIPEEYREKIFEAYRQVDGSDARAYPGTGLGLTIAKQIIELHNGTISVAPGTECGSVFTITLPVSEIPVIDEPAEIKIENIDDTIVYDTEPDYANIPSDLTDISNGKPVFLVVDDDPVNVRVLQNCFETRNCIVKTADDGIKALEIIDSDDPPDLVLLDIMMPVISGYEVCRRIRMKYSHEDLPVIMLTAKNMIADIDAAFEAGANDYIPKPFHISELIARSGTMLKLRNVRKSAAGGLTIRLKNGAHPFLFSEIIYITSFSKNVVIHTIKNDFELPILMKELLVRLPMDIFVRIHKSYIINITFVQSISHVKSGRYRVNLRDDDDTGLPVGGIFLDSLRKKIEY